MTKFEFEVGSLTDFDDLLFHGELGIKSEAEVSCRVRTGNVTRALRTTF